MEIFQIILDEIFSFLGIGQLIERSEADDYSPLLTFEGFRAAIYPLIPLLLIIELGKSIVNKKFKESGYSVIFFIHLFNRFTSRFISIAAVAFCIGLFESYALFTTTITWYWIVYGYIVWELAHFVYHYLGHKVRLFWCLHSTHHAPESMNLSVSYAHFFLEAPYADVIRTSICILLGVSPPLLFFIMFIDGFWGTFIHIGENIMKDGRMGFLNKIIFYF